MRVVNLHVRGLMPAAWNANIMDDEGQRRLEASLERYGLVQNLVVRPVGSGAYEVLSGNQRLMALKETGVARVPCVVVELDDAQARLLAQAMNRINGEDDLGLRAELIRQVLKEVPKAEVLALLPETAESLKGLETLGLADLTEHLQAWEYAQATRLRHLTVQLTGEQLHTVEEAFERVGEGDTSNDGNPNTKGNALYRLSKHFLETAS